jgi:hypothetical protein
MLDRGFQLNQLAASVLVEGSVNYWQGSLLYQLKQLLVNKFSIMIFAVRIFKKSFQVFVNSVTVAE